MGQSIVFGMDCGTRKLDMVSDTGVLRKKSLFYDRVEAYFAVYDSVVLTGPFTQQLCKTETLICETRK